ncbi:MAG: DUF4157 domain-containing protein [Polyangia bacterium]
MSNKSRLHLDSLSEQNESKRSASAGTDGGGDDGLSARAASLMQMHRSMGNAAIQMMSRAPVLRKARSDAPSWMEEELGITNQHKTNFAKMEQSQADAGQFSRSGAQPLPDSAKAAAEEHHGYKMDNVRVIQGAQADKYCDNMNAQAFCTPGGGGSDIFMHSSVDMNSKQGQSTLQHEITHAVQNAEGKTAGLSGLGGDAGTRNSLEAAADSHADAIMAKGVK